MENDYNGWTNRETWAVNLWIENDRGLYDLIQEKTEEAMGSVRELADMIESAIDEAFSDIEEMTPTGLIMLKDIGSLYRVNWYEIAESILSELKTQEEKTA
jgi:hypothetical protein